MDGDENCRHSDAADDPTDYIPPFVHLAHKPQPVRKENAACQPGGGESVNNKMT
jgi:hypothetical protein